MYLYIEAYEIKRKKNILSSILFVFYFCHIDSGAERCEKKAFFSWVRAYAYILLFEFESICATWEASFNDSGKNIK